jgi:hypothetical protein
MLLGHLSAQTDRNNGCSVRFPYVTYFTSQLKIGAEDDINDLQQEIAGIDRTVSTSAA